MPSPAPTLFSTDTLLQVVESLVLPPSFLLDTFFPRVQQFDDQYVHFDLIDKKRRLAPFCSPLVEGKIVREVGRTVKTFEPAYIKDKRVFQPQRPLVRIPGETIGGSLSPMDRLRANIARDAQDQVEMVRRRMEKMSAEAMFDGTVTVTGEGYPTTVVDFGRDASLKGVVPGILWSSASTAVPLDNLQDWALLVLKKSGAMPKDVVMDIDAWKLFRATAQVSARLSMFRSTGGEMLQAASFGEGATFMGHIDGFNIWVYSAYYWDGSADQPFFPSGTVMLAGSQVEGVQAYGAILDESVGYAAVPYAVKSWVENDPPVRLMMLQSAPLVVPTRVNAMLTADVN